MRLSKPSKTESVVFTVALAIVAALVHPPAHYRETRSESCHLCGNRRVTIREYRWWRRSKEWGEPVESFPVPIDHVHDWWQYGSSYTSYMGNWAASGPHYYRDGQHQRRDGGNQQVEAQDD